MPGIKRGRGEVILAPRSCCARCWRRAARPGSRRRRPGLREGIFLTGLLAPADPPLVPTCAPTSVRNLARQHGVDLVHAEHIAGLAHQLLEALPGAGLPEPGEPELVEAAALLHDVGMAVDYDDHHKHSSYLILGGGLPGFTPREVALIALMARYHRKGTPQLGALAPLCRDGRRAAAAARRGAAADRRAARAQPRPGRARGAADAARRQGRRRRAGARRGRRRHRRALGRRAPGRAVRARVRRAAAGGGALARSREGLRRGGV